MQLRMLWATECKPFISRQGMRLRSRWKCWVCCLPREAPEPGPCPALTGGTEGLRVRVPPGVLFKHLVLGKFVRTSQLL